MAFDEVLKNDKTGKKRDLVRLMGFDQHNMNVDSFKHNLDTIKTKMDQVNHDKQGKCFMLPGGRMIPLGEINRSILEWVDRFKQIGDIIMQYDPGHAALPWAGFRFILQVTNSATSVTVLFAHDKITDDGALPGLHQLQSSRRRYFDHYRPLWPLDYSGPTGRETLPRYTPEDGEVGPNFRRN